MFALIACGLWLSRGGWSWAIAHSLVCDSELAASDAILLDNFDQDYLLFERARQLRTAGLAHRILVPVPMDEGTDGQLNLVAVGTTELLARVSKVGAVEFIPIRQVEPISLNAAMDIRRFIQQERIHTLIVVTPLFRSRRSQLVYRSTLESAGVVVRCEPLRSSRGLHTWTESWHGIQQVAEQWLKLQYYRFYVLPFVLPDQHIGTRLP